MPCFSRRLSLDGRVQGVGFRPFVYRLARELGLCGWVRNETGRVELLVQGDMERLEAFGRRLLGEAPPLARPRLAASAMVDEPPHEGFEILPSGHSATPHIHLPPDHFACDDCLAELADPAARRYRYPFTNCTQCGPRYTLITALPYDRPNTTLAGFPLCPECAREYRDPGDRRFHAQPLACPRCGPRLELAVPGGAPPRYREEALAGCLELLRGGAVVAVKGIGGYHLLCDAGSEAAVAGLRRRKPRPHKPLAVMFPLAGADGLDRLRQALAPTGEEAELLRSPMRPIVLIAKRPGGGLAAGIAPGLAEVGAMLPYSPLHQLLLEGFGAPLVATSGNLSGEPVLTDELEAERRLAGVADAFLHHDRPIARPADDPLFRRIAGRCRPLRLGRGAAPLELELPRPLPRPLLALGGQMKNAVALAWENRVVLSPHVGELDTPRGLALFERLCSDLQRLYQMRAELLVLDPHPGYSYRHWATASGLPLLPAFHHHAHAAALAGEHPEVEEWLVFTWDGVGYGPDGTLWGGEALLGRPGAWRRFAALRPFRLPGGERAGRQPWRSAAALCWEAGLAGPEEAPELLKQAWERGLNSPFTSAAGRLFDGAAALLGLCREASFEGQGPMLLEAAAGPGEAFVELPLAEDGEGVLRCDWAPLLGPLQDAGMAPAERAALFHESLARALLAQALAARKRYRIGDVGLAGGVFQNRRLGERAVELLEGAGLRVHLGRKVPSNDAGLAYGQVIEALYAVPDPRTLRRCAAHLCAAQ